MRVYCAFETYGENYIYIDKDIWLDHSVGWLEQCGNDMEEYDRATLRDIISKSQLDLDFDLDVYDYRIVSENVELCKNEDNEFKNLYE